ncbi:DUF4199 domain-containing protein [Jiulongibacter sediminis]|uniref:DUF4199 domain-containing protein n=1 Tax=Jiulongibacter sediminis TaxID=1605367 RepID=UPI0026EB75A9|nr:DUF4199 domain-containing protein [Jiulongibacter sediminis]
MSKAAIKYGLISGAIVSILLAFSAPYMINNQGSLGTSQLMGYISMMLALVLIYFGIRERKMKELGGEITFLDALKTGAMIALICSVIYTISWMIISGIYPEVNESIANMYRNEINAKDIDDAQKAVELAEVNEMMQNYQNPIFKFGITMLEILPLGLVVSLISSIILRTKNNNA